MLRFENAPQKGDQFVAQRQCAGSGQGNGDEYFPNRRRIACG